MEYGKWCCPCSQVGRCQSPINFWSPLWPPVFISLVRWIMCSRIWILCQSKDISENRSLWFNLEVKFEFLFLFLVLFSWCARPDPRRNEINLHLPSAAFFSSAISDKYLLICQTLSEWISFQLFWWTKFSFKSHGCYRHRMFARGILLVHNKFKFLHYSFNSYSIEFSFLECSYAKCRCHIIKSFVNKV